jgi:hypothetical protein
MLLRFLFNRSARGAVYRKKEALIGAMIEAYFLGLLKSVTLLFDALSYLIKQLFYCLSFFFSILYP